NVEIHAELVRMRPHADRINLVFLLVLDPVVDHVGGEDVPLEQELVVVFQLVQSFVQRAGRGADLLVLVGGQVIDVLVHRAAGVDLVLDPIDGGHGNGAEGEVGVARGVGTGG